MKLITVYSLLVFLGCKTTNANEGNKITEQTTKTVVSPEKASRLNPVMCPEDGNCSWELFSNTTLVMKDDIVSKYPVLEPKGGVHVLKFKYHKKSPKGLADGSYSEVVLIEIEKDLKEINRKDEALQDIKVTYGRLCYCKGATGYVPVKKGEITILKEQSGYEIMLHFENEVYPQLIKEFNGHAVETKKQ